MPSWHARNNFTITGNMISDLHKYWHHIPRNILDVLANDLLSNYFILSIQVSANMI
jgi:hypothetical protein